MMPFSQQYVQRAAESDNAAARAWAASLSREDNSGIAATNASNASGSSSRSESPYVGGGIVMEAEEGTGGIIVAMGASDPADDGGIVMQAEEDTAVIASDQADDISVFDRSDAEVAVADVSYDYRQRDAAFDRASYRQSDGARFDDPRYEGYTYTEMCHLAAQGRCTRARCLYAHTWGQLRLRQESHTEHLGALRLKVYWSDRGYEHKFFEDFYADRCAKCVFCSQPFLVDECVDDQGRRLQYPVCSKACLDKVWYKDAGRDWQWTDTGRDLPECYITRASQYGMDATNSSNWPCVWYEPFGFSGR